LSGTFSTAEIFAQEDTLEFEYDEESGPFEILDTIEAQLTNGNVTSITADPDFNSIVMTLSTDTSDGTLDVILPRAAIDAKDGDNDIDFIVAVDAIEAVFVESGSDEAKRELEISIPAGAQVVEIVGTQIVPEFPFHIIGLTAILLGLMVIIGRTRFAKRAPQA
jgi:hypothetical protein